MKIFHTLLLGLSISVPLFATPSAIAEPTSQQQTKATGLWIDVRSAEEFQQGHLSGAINLTHNEIAQKIAQISPNKNEPIHLYCRSGRRAEAALNELKKLGYSNVTNHGGYEDLIKQGFK